MPIKEIFHETSQGDPPNMRKRPTTSNTEVAAIDHRDAVKLMREASICKKKRSKIGRSSVSIPFLSLFILLAGVLLVRSSSNDSLSEGEKIAAFMNWFRGAGGNVSNMIAIETFPDMGRGIVALQSVEENDALLFVPKNIIICYDTIAQEWSSQPTLKNKMKKLGNDHEELLTAFLMLEQAKGQASRWAPYLQLLPSFSSRKDVASPLLFGSEGDVDALQDERMIKAARAERQRVKKAHGRFKRLFRSFVDGETLDLTQYVWARFLVNSRAFSIHGERVLVPFGDVFNGKPDDEARQHDNGQRFLLFHDLKPEGMTIRADRSTMIGEQLFEDYGDNSNYVYFLYHGFLMDDRGFDCAAFRLSPLADAYSLDEENKEQAEMLASKSRVLTRIRVDDAPLACISRAGQLEDSGMMRIYTALFYMDAEQVAVCNNAEAFSECFPPELIPDFDTEPERREISLLLNATRLRLEKYATTLEEDFMILKDIAMSSCKKHAVAFRMSRKQILRDAKAVLEQRLQHLDEEIKVNDHENQLGSANDREHDEDGSGSNKLERFQHWITRHNIPVNHLELRYISEAIGYGTFASKPLSTGDVYLKVPVEIVMNLKSAVKSRWVSQTMFALQKMRVNVLREEILLLLHLLEEKFGPNHYKSRWKPYLDMLPVLEDQENILASPLFYDEDGEQLKMLKGTDLLSLIANYRQRVDQAYAVLNDHIGNDATSKWLSERRFRWANAILDSRSIWWNSQRHLVPLLDMVNCQELNANHKPHHTNLDSSGRHAVTKSSWNFEVGQEVVENYAQPNYIYLLYHGFVLDTNSYDCAHFHLEIPTAVRQREFSLILRTLEIHSWTPDVCVSPNDKQQVERFSKIALLMLNPKQALQLLGNAATATPLLQAIAAASNLTDERLNRFQSTGEGMATTDFRTQSILKFRKQQFHLFTTLRNKLQSMTNSSNK